MEQSNTLSDSTVDKKQLQAQKSKQTAKDKKPKNDKKIADSNEVTEVQNES